MSKIRFLVVHHFGGTDSDPKADTSNQTFEIVDDYHRQKWEFLSSLGHYCGYNYVIEKNGKITQARADGEETAAVIGHNNDSIHIALAGNFDVTLPTNEQIESLRKLLIIKTEAYTIPLSNIVPHRVFAKKSCYGLKLKDDWARNLCATYFLQKSALKTQLELLNGQLKDIYRTYTTPIMIFGSRDFRED